MKKAALLTLSVSLMCAGSMASDHAFAATADEAKALVERAAAHVKEVGEEQAFKDSPTRTVVTLTASCTCSATART